MQCLVAYGAVKAAGFLNSPVLDSVTHKEVRPEDIEVEAGENKALIVKEGTAAESVDKVKVAVVGASLMIVDMLVSRYTYGNINYNLATNIGLNLYRGISVIGVCSASSATTVLSNGAAAVLDRTQGGLASRPPGLSLDVVIDCVGGQEIEDVARADRKSG